MDNIFDPTQRKWISPLVNLGECMKELKGLVRLRAEDLAVIDPPNFDQNGESGEPPRYLKMLMDTENEPGVHHYLRPEHAAAVEQLTEEISKKNANKWSESDASCEAAVSLVGGEKFFLFGKEKADSKTGAKEHPTPGPSASSAKASKKPAYESTVEENGEDEKKETKPEESDPAANPVEDFKRFSEWVFNQNIESDIENANMSSESDDSCEAADSFVGGKKFFLFGKEKADGKTGAKEHPTPGPSASSAKASKKPVYESTVEENGEDEKKETKPEESDPATDPIEDFKRFSEWVFNQNIERDIEIRRTLRPELMKKLNLAEKSVRDYQNFTSANMTSVRGEVFQDDPVMQSSSMPLLAPPANKAARTTLQSLAVFITHGDDPSVFPWKSINVQQQMNDDFVNHEFLKQMEQQKRDLVNPAMKDELVNKEEDFLVQVLIYQATDPDEVLPDEVKLYFEPKLAYEVHLLGSQTVKDLMMAFHCENDYVCLKEVTHPDHFKQEQIHYAKDEFPDAMILINDTIYTDPKTTVDYVGIINAWAAKPPAKKIGPFKYGDWNTKLRELTLSFGFPYVFIHLGGCEHIYVITKSRLLHVEDDHLLKNYPKIVGMTRFKNVYCRVDNEYLARWAVLDYKEFPENPMLLCTECVVMYCYDQHKKKRGDFRLYPFTQMANIL